MKFYQVYLVSRNLRLRWESDMLIWLRILLLCRMLSEKVRLQDGRGEAALQNTDIETRLENTPDIPTQKFPV